MDLEAGPGEVRTISLRLEGDLTKGFMDWQKLYLGGPPPSISTGIKYRRGHASTPLHV